MHNHRQAITNIHKLLKPNGTSLLAFLISNPIFDIYLDLSRMNKYSKYMNDVEKFISPYHFEEHPLEIFTDLLYDAGFKIFHIEIKSKIFVFDDVELLKCKFYLDYKMRFYRSPLNLIFLDSVKAVNPFSGRMPENLQNEFLSDYIKKVDELNLITLRGSVITPYKLMVAVVGKEA
jgi:juvenile hormone-III synthase